MSRYKGIGYCSDVRRSSYTVRICNARETWSCTKGDEENLVSRENIKKNMWIGIK